MLVSSPAVVVPAESADDPSKVSGTSIPQFERDIAPILERRCVSCHNAETREGQLGLHDRTSIEQGGESAHKIVNVAFGENELWRRVAGQDAELRMPAEGPPLDGNDLATIERWARAGAPWPPEASQDAMPPDGTSWFDQCAQWVPPLLDPWIEEGERWRSEYGSALALLLAWVFGIALAERLKRSSGSPSTLVTWIRRFVTPALYAWLAVGVAAWGGWLHVVAVHARERMLADRVAELEKDARKFTAPPVSFLVDLEPERPKHPPRLGGTYYRGNDERSPSLFNGGFYRTATMHLSLRDGTGRRLVWGDPMPPRDVFVCVEIERAPMASPTLYRPAIMAKTFLSPCRPLTSVTDLASMIYPFETIEEGERWVGRAPIQLRSLDADGSMILQGTLFLYNGACKEDRIPERPHFGIQYQITVKDGVIQPGSDLWMGSLYRLTRIFYPPQDRILPSEWFDAREIPVIEGHNTSDPKLLGVEEHRHKLENP